MITSSNENCPLLKKKQIAKRFIEHKQELLKNKAITTNTDNNPTPNNEPAQNQQAFFKVPPATPNENYINGIPISVFRANRRFVLNYLANWLMPRTYTTLPAAPTGQNSPANDISKPNI